MRDAYRRLAGILLLPTAVSLLPAATASAAEDVVIVAADPDPAAPALEDVTVPTAEVDLGVVEAPLRFAAGEGVALELADGRRFLDTIELRQPGDGQVLVNDLTLDDYVAGVAEMPSRWHLEALKAQAVAARTYAWYQAELGTFAARGYDICDTVDCQAFVGAAQEEGDDGDRWRAAVDATSGQVLVDADGAPILARYFSTSGGRTLPNEVVFPSSGPRPYLTGVDDPADAVSPYHRWEVTFTREEFDRILGRGESLAAASPVASVERLGPVDEPGADLRVTGRDGTEVVVDSVDLRRFVSSVAPELYPDRFPTARSDGFRPLPTTLPSSRFEVTVGEDEVVVSGRGWGHAVGMGQYGALGRAGDGADHTEILAAYYGGLEPTTSDAAPDRVRVGLSRPAVGSVTPDSPMTITAAGDVVAERVAGTWGVASEDGRVRLSAPPGWGQPAEVSRTEEAVGVPTLPRAIAVEAVTAVPGLVALRVTRAAGEVVLERSVGARGAGRHVTVWDLTDSEGELVATGTYEVALAVTAADGSVAATPLSVDLEVPDGATAADADGGTPWLAWLSAAGVLAAALALLRGARRRTATNELDGPIDPERAHPRRSR
ncbi:MAG: SpoIID/LytB domain-containing protein [Nitriliruptor sp.]